MRLPGVTSSRITQPLLSSTGIARNARGADGGQASRRAPAGCQGAGGGAGSYGPGQVLRPAGCKPSISFSPFSIFLRNLLEQMIDPWVQSFLKMIEPVQSESAPESQDAFNIVPGSFPAGIRHRHGTDSSG